MQQAGNFWKMNLCRDNDQISSSKVIIRDVIKNQ